MTANSLLNHTEPSVNVIMEDSSIKVKTKVDEVKSSMEELYKVFVKIWVILEKEIFTKENEESDCYYLYHAACIRHII